MKVPKEGCVICEASWGNYWAEIDGQRMFFCCDICANEFRNMVEEVKRRTGWKSIDEIKMTGDYRGRTCTAQSHGSEYRFHVRFDSKGNLLTFLES